MADPSSFGASLRGTVTRLDDDGYAWVEVVVWGRGQEFGPCEALTTSTPPKAGDRVLLAQVAPGDAVIVGVLP